MPDQNILVSPTELADKLGVSLRTVKRWTKEGTLPQPIRIKGNVLRYNYPEVISYIEQNQEVQNG